MLDVATVKCQNAALGCAWEGRVDAQSQHLIQCPALWMAEKTKMQAEAAELEKKRQQAENTAQQLRAMAIHFAADAQRERTKREQAEKLQSQLIDEKNNLTNEMRHLIEDRMEMMKALSEKDALVEDLRADKSEARKVAKGATTHNRGSAMVSGGTSDSSGDGRHAASPPWRSSKRRRR